ncbi:hypothetical protein MSG28_008796 [Choristoneura fumiferana]|uniref:Uncharacterized protein n=1 Tax=Choristoneura fumiferana TaxID=7141 RepID=A0ACC0J8C7_CHOFU|nr:hypothetical protein MSG28_008796 [Choristoneura fumiferana]
MARGHSDTVDSVTVPAVRGSLATLASAMALLDKEVLDLTVVANEVSGIAAVVSESTVAKVASAVKELTEPVQVMAAVKEALEVAMVSLEVVQEATAAAMADLDQIVNKALNRTAKVALGLMGMEVLHRMVKDLMAMDFLDRMEKVALDRTA